MSKSQQLLDNLKTRTEPKRPEPKIIIPYSNQHGEDDAGNPIFIDRIYGSNQNHNKLIQKDGTEYQGKIHVRSRLRKKLDGSGNFRQTLYVTDDGRWFDNSGMPMDKPSDTSEENTNE